MHLLFILSNVFIEKAFQLFLKMLHGSGNCSRFLLLLQKWSDSETKMLEEGVKMFGEGNWNKIREYYDFNGRTNVNLKDRWRTMKKLYMV